MVKHSTECPKSGRWYVEKECREFSTDGTWIGANIAHLYGTKDDDAIAAIQAAERKAEVMASLTGMEEEQADWESDLEE